MSEYTPTTAQVRAVYADGESEGTPEDYAEFDRWLAAHDAEVRERALRDAEDAAAEALSAFTAAYRAQNGNVIPIGAETVIREQDRTTNHEISETEQ